MRIGVLRGGISDQYDISLLSGGAVLNALRSLGHKPIDILITKDGSWNMNGLPLEPEELTDKIDFIWNALHGEIGEDGMIQEFFDTINIPYTGSGKEASEIFSNKLRAKELFKELGLKTPSYEYIPVFDERIFGDDIEKYSKGSAKRVWQSFSPPWVVKPLSGGSSKGIILARTFQELVDAIESVIVQGNDALVEEFVDGKEVSLGIIEGLRGEKQYTLIPKEVVKDGKILSTYDRASGNYSFRTLGSIDNHHKEDMSEKFAEIFDRLNLKHYAVADFIISPRGLYILEIDTLPELHDGGIICRSLNDLGISMPEFVNHIIMVAQKDL